MTLDNMTGITEGSYTGFCKSQMLFCPNCGAKMEGDNDVCIRNR